MLDRDSKSKEFQINRVLGKIPNLYKLTLSKEYEKDIQELTAEEQENLKEYNLIYSYIHTNRESLKTDEILSWRKDILQWKLPKYIRVPENYVLEEITLELQDNYEYAGESIFKRKC